MVCWLLFNWELSLEDLCYGRSNLKASVVRSNSTLRLSTTLERRWPRTGPVVSCASVSFFFQDGLLVFSLFRTWSSDQYPINLFPHTLVSAFIGTPNSDPQHQVKCGSLRRERLFTFIISDLHFLHLLLRMMKIPWLIRHSSRMDDTGRWIHILKQLIIYWFGGGRFRMFSTMVLCWVDFQTYFPLGFESNKETIGCISTAFRCEVYYWIWGQESNFLALCYSRYLDMVISGSASLLSCHFMFIGRTRCMNPRFSHWTHNKVHFSFGNNHNKKLEWKIVLNHNYYKISMSSLLHSKKS